MFGKAFLLITFMMKGQLRNSSMKILQNKVSYQFLKAIMRLYWLMDRLEQEKHIQWRDLNIKLGILKEELYQEAWKKSLNLFKCNLTKILLLWFE